MPSLMLHYCGHSIDTFPASRSVRMNRYASRVVVFLLIVN